MDLLSLVIVLILIGVGLMLVNKIPMDAAIKQIINYVVIVVVVLCLLRLLGLFAGLETIWIGPRR